MPTPTYNSIATYTSPNNSETTVSFENIPATYTDLVLVVQAGASDANENLAIRYNNDSGANYKYQRIRSSSSSTDSPVDGASSMGMLTAMDGTGTAAQWIININGYSDTYWYKHTLWEGGYASVNHGQGQFLWLNSSAINRIDISNQFSAKTFRQGSTFSLYGILKA